MISKCRDKNFEEGFYVNKFMRLKNYCLMAMYYDYSKRFCSQFEGSGKPHPIFGDLHNLMKKLTSSLTFKYRNLSKHKKVSKHIELPGINLNLNFMQTKQFFVAKSILGVNKSFN